MADKQDEFDRQFDEYAKITQPNKITPEGFIAHCRRSGFQLTPAASPQPFAQGKPPQ